MQTFDSKQNALIEPEIEESTRALIRHDGDTGAVAYLRIAWEHRRSVGRAVVIGFVVSTLIAFLIPKKYEATARIMPPTNQSSALSALAGLTNMPAGLGGMLGDLVGAKTTGATFVGMLQSRTIADRIIARFNLNKVYSIRYPEDVRKRLRSLTDVSEDRKSGIISVTVTDKDPKRAADMAQAYVAELDRVAAELSTSRARREREFLETRLQVVKQELEQSEVEFSQFSSKNSTLDIKEQGKAMLDAAARLEAELIAAQTEVQGLRQIYTDSNVRVRSAQARVSELQRKLNELGGGSAQGTGEAGTSKSDSDFAYPSIRQLPVVGVSYANLYRRMKTAEVVYELLTREYELAKVEEAKEIPTVKELDKPVVPEKKSFPPRLLIMAIGTITAFLGAIAWTCGAQVWSEVDVEDPRKQLVTEMARTARKALPWRKPVTWSHSSESTAIKANDNGDRQ